MAPQRATKNANTTSTSESATRSGSRTSRREEGSDDTTDSDMIDVADEDKEELEETQSSKSAEELLSNMVAGARKRHNAQIKKVFESYNTTCSVVEDSITTLVDEHEEKSSAAHEAQLKRLKELLNYKAKLEVAMEAKLMALRMSYDAHSRDLENVLNARIRDLE